MERLVSDTQEVQEQVMKEVKFFYPFTHKVIRNDEQAMEVRLDCDMIYSSFIKNMQRFKFFIKYDNGFVLKLPKTVDCVDYESVNIIND